LAINCLSGLVFILGCPSSLANTHWPSSSVWPPTVCLGWLHVIGHCLHWVNGLLPSGPIFFVNSPGLSVSILSGSGCHPPTGLSTWVINNWASSIFNNHWSFTVTIAQPHLGHQLGFIVTVWAWVITGSGSNNNWPGSLSAWARPPIGSLSTPSVWAWLGSITGSVRHPSVWAIGSPSTFHTGSLAQLGSGSGWVGVRLQLGPSH